MRTLSVVLAAIAALPLGALPALGQPQPGWIEGRVRNEQGHPESATLELFESASGSWATTPKSSSVEMDGLYSFRELRPGVYELQVRADGYRPQRIFGITVTAGARTLLDIRLERGTGLQELAEPPVVTRTVIDVEAELAALRRQIAELRGQLETLRGQVEVLRTRPR